MLSTITALFSILSSGAGGGIVGGIFGLFKQSQERKERVAMAEIDVKRDILEYKNAEAERNHALVMLDKAGSLELEKVQTEAEAEVEVTHQNALSAAQDVFKNLNTSRGLDNYRASVRPTLAYWGAGLFSVMLCRAFYKYNGTIDEETGKQILLGMFGTLTFIVTSITAFYYLSRKNSAPRG